MIGTQGVDRDENDIRRLSYWRGWLLLMAAALNGSESDGNNESEGSTKATPAADGDAQATADAEEEEEVQTPQQIEALRILADLISLSSPTRLASEP